MKNILIVGGSGFIGLKLIELKPTDSHVTATYNTKKKIQQELRGKKMICLIRLKQKNF